MKVEAGTVHLWVARTGQSAMVPEFWRILADDERARAERFRSSRDRDGFIVSRGVLRRILSEYVGVAPERIAFAYGEHGKPAVSGVQFNVSDSFDLVVVAVGDRAVGVDVERVRSRPNAARFAARFFTPAEAEAIASSPDHDRDRWFFACWTRKEAFVKAIGGGLSIPLKSFSVECDPSVVRPALSAPGRTLSSFAPAPGFAGAVCTEGDSALELLIRAAG